MISVRRLIVIIIIITLACILPQLSYAAEKYKIKTATIAPIDTPWHAGFLAVKNSFW